MTLMDPGKDSLNLHEASSILGVSSSTVRNWVKHEYLRPLEDAGRLAFSPRDIARLKGRIARGSLSRLSSRANKGISNRTFIPDEYLGNSRNRDMIQFLVNSIREWEIPSGRALFLLALNILKGRGIIGNVGLRKMVTFGARHYRNREAALLMKDWYRRLGRFDILDGYDALVCCSIPDEEDLLGLIYQSLLREGAKAHRGSYYTPRSAVEHIAEERLEQGMRVLDPCCGTGRFLLTFSGKAGDPSLLWGFDTDETAVAIARLNLIIRFRDVDFTPRVYAGNSLLRTGNPELTGGFDFIATNPPWGTHDTVSDRNIYREIYPQVRSGESFSYFLARSLELLKKDGRLSFILPESFLSVKIHRDIRKHVMEHAEVEKIIPLGRIFKNVFSPVIRLDLKKRGHGLKDLAGGSGSPGKIHKSVNFNFIVPGSGGSAIMDKVYEVPHVTLKGNARWVLGIVTGNNREYLSGTPGKGMEAIITGKDVERFRIREGRTFIRLCPGRFQQMAPMEKYRAGEKLVYRFISKNLVFAWDGMGRLTLNSANIVIPEIESYPMKAVMALFNSSLYQYIFQKKFRSIKVLRSHIEELPLPLWDRGVIDEIQFLAGCMIQGSDQFSELDRLIMNTFRLTGREMRAILS